jgi:hypothetical protein
MLGTGRYIFIFCLHGMDEWCVGARRVHGNDSYASAEGTCPSHV